MTGLSANEVVVVVDGHRILRAIDLTVAPGEVVALVGPNGAGKSTLLSVLSGDLPATSGQVQISGKPIGAYRHLDLARERAVTVTGCAYCAS